MVWMTELLPEYVFMFFLSKQILSSNICSWLQCGVKWHKVKFTHLKPLKKLLKIGKFDHLLQFFEDALEADSLRFVKWFPTPKISTICIGSKPNDTILFFDQSLVSSDESVQLHGVTIDFNLKFKEQASLLCKKPHGSKVFWNV